MRGKGAVINYDREGGGSISENSYEEFKTPTYPADKNSNPIKISKNNFRPQHIITERKHHILVSNACDSICPFPVVSDTIG